MPFLITTDVLGSEGKQRQMTGSLDGNGQAALMLGTGSSLTPGFDLAPLGQEPSQGRNVLIVDRLCLFKAKRANFAALLKASPESAPSLAT